MFWGQIGFDNGLLGHIFLSLPVYQRQGLKFS